MLDNTPHQPYKFMTKNWLKIDDESQGVYDKDNQIRFKISMLRPRFCDYSDLYILFKWTITVASTAAKGAANNAANEKVILNNCAPLANWISRVNNTQAFLFFLVTLLKVGFL